VGLTGRLSIAIAGAMLIGSVVLLFTSVIQEKRHSSEELISQLDDDMNLLLITLPEQVVIGDYATIEKMLNSKIKSINIESIIYTDTYGKSISAIDKPVASIAPQWFGSLIGMPEFTKKEEVIIGSRKYGSVELNLTTTPSANHVWMMFERSAQALLLVLVLAIVITYLIVRYSLRPLVELAVGARRIGSGDYSARIPEQGTAEMTVTIGAFNQMAHELTQTIDELKQSKDKVSALYNGTPIMLHSIDRMGNLIEVNNYWLKTMGYERGEVIGRKVVEFYTETSRKYALESVQPAFFQSGIAQNIEYQFVKKNGELIDVLLSAVGERDAGRNVVRSLAVIEDITERKRAQEALRRSEETLQKIMDSASAVIFAKDLEGKYIFINTLFEKLFHITRTEIIGKTDFDIFSKNVADAFRIADLQALQAGKPIEAEETVPQDDGIHYYISLKFPLYDNNKKPYAVCGMATDITERKRFEEQSLKSQKLESIGTLAGGIAHDFNNLLQGVFGYISLAKIMANDKEKSSAALEQAEKALHQSINLTTQLLTFSKGGKPAKKLVDIRPVVENSARFTLSGSRSDLRLTIPKDLWQVEADEGQIGQVIQNIVLNADQAMPIGGTVKVTAANMAKNDASLPPGLVPGDYVIIAVQDSGVGIPEQYLNKIFDPYFTTKEKGSGLGLATSYSIVRNHGGMIDIATKSGVGSTFMIYLPAIAGQVRTESTEKQHQTPHPSRARVLLMDDEEVVRTISSELLGVLGQDVEVANNGQEALDKYRSAIAAGSPFDIVILDLTIRGGMGGVETVQQLLKMDPQVKAVVSSGYSDDATISNYLSQGFKACLKKPYDIDALREVLNSILAS
jgi:PAS domain S-box-containing protein